MSTVHWGILSTAKIGIQKVIPAIQQAENCSVGAIASRSHDKAQQAADTLQIGQAYGSYEKLLADPDIDAIYNPLPNHLHVPLSIDALQAGKHVLCEKPIALDLKQAQKLQHAHQDYPQLKLMEAFMYRLHPQWQKAKSLVHDGTIGSLQTVASFFSYYNDDPQNIRNKPEMGGGGLMDIGCYCISLSRFLFDDEPQNINGTWKIDSQLGTDYLASGVLEFASGTATFSCSTQATPHQRVDIVGTKGRIVIHIPFNAPPNKRTVITLHTDGASKEISFDPIDQYTLQAQAFAQSILNDSPVPVPFSDAIDNMRIIDAFRDSATS